MARYWGALRGTDPAADGPKRDAVVLNAGAALAVYDGGVHDVVPAVASGMTRAAEAIDSGRAKDALSRWVAACAAV